MHVQVFLGLGSIPSSQVWGRTPSDEVYQNFQGQVLSRKAEEKIELFFKLYGLL